MQKKKYNIEGTAWLSNPTTQGQEWATGTKFDDFDLDIPCSMTAVANGGPLGMFISSFRGKTKMAGLKLGSDAIGVLQESQQVKGSNASAAMSEAVSMELFARLFGAKMKGTELEVGIGVDFACEINGQLCGVSVTRGHVTRLLDNKASVGKSDAAVCGRVEEQDEPMDGTCNTCHVFLPKDDFSNKQWKRVRAQLMGRGGHGGCCKRCSPKVIAKACNANDLKQSNQRWMPKAYAPDELLCAGCKAWVASRHYPEFNDEAKHPIQKGNNIDDVLAEQPELPDAGQLQIAQQEAGMEPLYVSKVLCRTCAHNRKRLITVVRGLNDPKAVEALISRKIDKLLSQDWPRKLLHIWLPEDLHAESICKITQEILDSRTDVDKMNFGIIMTRARFDGQQFVDSYLFGRSLAMA